jgi:orotate phosphoribosyltransferase
MVAIFTYGFQQAVDNFSKARCAVDALSNYEVLLNIAIETGYISGDDMETLKEWRKIPQNWKQ